MKILEINGFMEWAIDYEGDHEVVRWIPTARVSQETKSLFGFTKFRQGYRILREIPRMEIDLIICGSFGRAYLGGGVRRILKSFFEKMLIGIVKAIHRKAGVPLAVIDIADDHTIHPVNKALLDSADLYFKRELPLDPYHAFESLRSPWARRVTLKDCKIISQRGWVQKLRPISLGCRELEPLEEKTPLKEKRWDVFYAGDDLFRPRRTGVEDSIRALERLGYSICIPTKKLSIEEYMEAMSQARLAISPPGLGWDCHRHYEAAMVGTVAVTPFPIIQRYRPLKDGQHCLFYDTEKEMTEQLEKMLQDPKTLARIAEDAQAYSQEHHTHKAIFSSMINRVMEK
jgi:hypothetical protein